MNSSARSTQLVLFAHGSRDPRWRAPFLEMLATLRAELGESRVSLAFMEFAGPTLLEVAGDARSHGVDTLRLLPLFLAGGAHVAKDIPAQVAEVEKNLPGMRIEVMRPVGENPRFVELLLGIARESVPSPG